jgi:hypothetical protein
MNAEVSRAVLISRQAYRLRAIRYAFLKQILYRIALKMAAKYPQFSPNKMRQ